MLRAAAGLAALCAGALSAQAGGPSQGLATGSVTGVVRDSAGQPIAGALVRLSPAERPAETDERGRFSMPRVAAGSHFVEVRRLGFRPERVEVVVVAGVAAEVAVRMMAVASPLAPVVVLGREAVRGPLAGFYQRMERGEGRYITGEMIESRQLYTMGDLLRMVPGARVQTVRGRSTVRLRGATAPPIVFIDGVRMAAGEADLGHLNTRAFAGVEIYNGGATTPPEFAVSRISGVTGGVIVIWTREGEPAPRRRRRGAESAAALTDGLVASGEAYTLETVDSPARPSPGLPLTPMYPDSLFHTQTPGLVVAEFVVIEDGQVRAETISIVTSSHPAFGESVRRALITASFVPARKNGIPVAQVVQLPIRFVP